MTKEELQALLKESPELLEEAGFVPSTKVEEIANQKVEETVKGLKEKRDELLAKNKQLKEKLGGDTDPSKGVDVVSKFLTDLGVENVEQLEDAVFKMKHPDADEKTREFEKETLKAKREQERMLNLLKEKDAAIESKHAELSSAEQYISKILINDAFKGELSAQGYDPIMLDAIIPGLIMKSKAQVMINDKGERVVETDDSGSIKEWVQYWKDTPEGKALRGAPENTGGGAAGGSGGVANFEAWLKLPAIEKQNFHEKDPVRSRQYLEKQRRGF